MFMAFFLVLKITNISTYWCCLSPPSGWQGVEPASQSLGRVYPGDAPGSSPHGCQANTLGGIEVAPCCRWWGIYPGQYEAEIWKIETKTNCNGLSIFYCYIAKALCKIPNSRLHNFVISFPWPNIQFLQVDVRCPDIPKMHYICWHNCHYAW